VRQTIAVKGARENNLKNISLEIPRDQLIVVTGLSGSGKSSLAFETIYAEGQRKYLDAMSVYAKRFVAQLKKPDVDYVFGLSPVVSVEQKSIGKNPRSTVGTMTDIYDFIRILYTTVGVSHCPRCGHEIPIKSAAQIVERLLALPQNTAVELRAPLFKIYGEDFAYLFGEIRSKGYRRLCIDDEPVDISADPDLDEAREYEIEVVVDRFFIKPDIQKSLLASVEAGLRVGEGFLSFHVTPPEGAEEAVEDFTDCFACPAHRITMGEMQAYYFSFNESDSACSTCLGLGVYLKVHPDLLLPDKRRSIRGGAFIPEAFKYDKNNWAGRLMYSLAHHLGFSLDTPFTELPPAAVEAVLYGTHGEKFELLIPEGAKQGDQHVGKLFRYDGIINDIERRYRHYRREKLAHTWMEEYLKKVMVEHVCPDCLGTKLKRQRLLVTLKGRTIHELGALSLGELREFMDELPLTGRQYQAGEQIANEIRARLDLLIGIGLDYLNLNRRASTLAGGEAQRIRLSTQIGSGLMGMLYVLDEPSIGLHPKDNVKMINTLRRLRDIGNTVIVVEHDEETIRAADHLVEVGPGPGIHGGLIVAQGTVEEIIRHPNSLTGEFLSGRRCIDVPATRRSGNGKSVRLIGARENNLRDLDVTFPLGLLVCVTGASGSGKSTLVKEILYKRCYNHFHDSRVLSGAHDRIEGLEHLSDVIHIDQSAIGRSPRSNPATYIGFYDEIRNLFAQQPAARVRGYTASRFSFNVKGGRCEECAGAGMISTALQFMPDVETPCPVCKGARYNAETLDVTYRGKNIASVLDLSFEEARSFFSGHGLIAHKVDVVCQLGMGYLTLGQAATTLSGGEAQRVKLANELSKIKRGGRNLYILDEPTTGLHLADIQRLLDSLNRLIEVGNTVLVIEHHLDVIKTADWIIDLGPEGGHRGGWIVAQGTPEEVARHPESHTGRFLKPLLKTSPPSGANGLRPAPPPAPLRKTCA
jgi:excinuclease ABC subunit A